MKSAAHIRDAFLVERAAQIQRLRNRETGSGIDLPGRISRMRYSGAAGRLFQVVDRICQIPLHEERRQPLWKRLGLSLLSGKKSDDPDQGLLSPADRSLLNEFETLVVQTRLQPDPEPAAAANAIIQAIHRDHRNFLGLKPFAFQPQQFSYEFLFPSWLNLFTALTTSRSGTKSAGYSIDQAALIFGFLADVEQGSGDSVDELLGAFSFAANRLPPAESSRLIQRMMDLCACPSSSFHDAPEDRLRTFRERTTSADQLLQVLRAVTVVESCRRADEINSPYRLTELPPVEPLPRVLADRLDALLDSDEDFPQWVKLMSATSNLLDAGGALDGEFADMINRRSDRLLDWLSLLVEDGIPLSTTSQRLLARIVRREKRGDDALELARVRDFASQLAPRVGELDEPFALRFEQEFVEHDGNRRLILKAAGSQEARSQLSQKLLERARDSEEGGRMLARLMVAVVLDPAIDAEQLKKANRSAKVILLLKRQGFISDRQFEMLVRDIGQRLPEAVQFLIEPYWGARDQPEPIARLYIALHEECELYARTGKVGNFGLTRAAYTNLRRSVDGM